MERTWNELYDKLHEDSISDDDDNDQCPKVTLVEEQRVNESIT